jgi:hypothetical protein
MTARAWCAISKAVEMVATAQDTSQGRAQAWLIETCASGNVRARVPSSANPVLLLADDGLMDTDMRSRRRLSLFRKRAPGPVSPNIWKAAVIDGDALVDADHDHRRGIEVSIADLEFELKPSFPALDQKTCFACTDLQVGSPFI